MIIFIEEDDEELKNHLKNKLNKDNIEDIINLNKLYYNIIKGTSIKLKEFIRISIIK